MQDKIKCGRIKQTAITQDYRTHLETHTHTCKECFSSEHFSKDAPSGPHVNGFGVVIWGKEQTRRTIPFSDQSLRQMSLWERENISYNQCQSFRQRSLETTLQLQNILQRLVEIVIHTHIKWHNTPIAWAVNNSRSTSHLVHWRAHAPYGMTRGRDTPYPWSSCG